MLEKILEFFGVRVVSYQNIEKEKEISGCKCCTTYLMDNDCQCKEPQVIDYGDGTSDTYFTRGECGDWNCCYCY